MIWSMCGFTPFNYEIRDEIAAASELVANLNLQGPWAVGDSARLARGPPDRILRSKLPENILNSTSDWFAQHAYMIECLGVP